LSRGGPRCPPWAHTQVRPYIVGRASLPVIFWSCRVPAVFPADRHDRSSQLTMNIPRRVFQAEPSEESSSGGTGVSPVNDGQSRGTRDRPTNTGQSPEDRHSQAGAWEREEVDGGQRRPPHYSAGLSAQWRKYGHVFVYGSRCGSRRARTDRRRPLVGCGDSALRAGEPSRGTRDSLSSISEIPDLKTRIPRFAGRFIPLRGNHHILVC
jgi:hypothetical protein